MRHLPACLAALVVATAATADDNTIYLLQSSPDQGVLSGNLIEIDQSNSLFSQLGSEDAPLMQEGLQNQAKITVEGAGAQVTLSQRNTQTDGNMAEIMTYNGADANLLQEGSLNDATIVLDGQSLTGSLSQEGDNNTGTLLAVGNNASASLRQIGSNLVGRLEVEAYDATVQYTMQGYGTGVYFVDRPLQVQTNRDVFITQCNYTGVAACLGNGNNGNGNNGNGNGNNGNNGNGTGNGNAGGLNNGNGNGNAFGINN